MWHTDSQDASKRSDGLGKTVWLWPAVLPALLLLYWLTSSVVVATLIPSVIAALPALRTGWWIRGHELSLGCRIRANILWYFYLADALWLAAATAFTTVLILILISSQIGIQPNMTKFATAMLTIAAGVVMTTLIGLYAAFCAWRNPIRVWVHPKTYQWTRGVDEMLYRLTFQPQRFNHAVFILGTSLVTPCLLSGTAVLIAFTAHGERLSPMMQYLSLTVMLFFFVVMPISAVVAYGKVAGPVIAQQPSECWQRANTDRVDP